jgi:hypothetical protein
MLCQVVERLSQTKWMWNLKWFFNLNDFLTLNHTELINIINSLEEMKWNVKSERVNKILCFATWDMDERHKRKQINKNISASYFFY